MVDKKTYYAGLRAKRKEAKVLAESGQFQIPMGISWTGYVFCKLQMKNLGLQGEPWIDMKTFKGWTEAGFKVKKGEKSQVKGLTRLKSGSKGADDDDGYVFPKVYHLFHSSQVEPLGATVESKQENKLEQEAKTIQEMDNLQALQYEQEQENELAISEPVLICINQWRPIIAKGFAF